MGTVKFDNTTYQFDELEAKYRNFFAPGFEVWIDGVNVLRESVAITDVRVDTSIEPKADSFSFTVGNAWDLVKREFQWIDAYFSLGKYVEIRMGYVDKLETVFCGLITSVDFQYPADGNPVLSVRGMDIAFLMMRGKCSRTWHNKKDGDLAREIGQLYTSNVVIDDTALKQPVTVQDRMDDFSFLTQLAQRNHYDFFIVGNTMYFRKPLKDKAPVVTLVYGKNLRQFSTDMNLSSQVGQVIVRGWDQKQRKVIEGRSSDVQKLGSNSKTGQDIMNLIGKKSTHYVYTNVHSDEEAKKRADAILNKRAMQLVHGSGESIGIPEIRAGRYLALQGLGKSFSQPLYLTAVQHVIGPSGYVTSFEVGGNAV